MKKKILLCLVSGVLTGLSFDSPYLSYLVWFSLVPFIYVISKSNDLKTGIWSGFIFSIGFSAVSIFWLSNVTILGLVFLLLYLSIYPVTFLFFGRFFLKRPLSLLTLPALWVVLEFVRENIWCGFGWINLGYSQYKNLYLIQPADLFGVKLISFVIIMVNVLFFEILFRRKRHLLVKIFIVSAVISGSVGYSVYKLKNIKPEEYMDVSLVQTNIEQELKWDESAAEFIIDKLAELGSITPRGSLVIFPEASWPYMIDYDDLDTVNKRLLRKVPRYMVLGGIRKSKGKFYNAAFIFREDGLRMGYYDKIKLVPFGEYVPLRSFLKFISVINAIGDITPGRIYREFPYQGKFFSILICFEDVLPGHVWQFSQDKDFLINMTNDGWFGGNPQAYQHLGIMVFRAIENRIPIIRCANTGISGWVSSLGKIEKLEHQTRDVLFEGVGNFKVALARSFGLYQIWGELFSVVCGLILMGSIIFKNER